MSANVLDIYAAVEEDGAVLQARCPDSKLPLWMLVRFHYLRSLLDRTLWEHPAKDRFAIPKAPRGLRARLRAGAFGLAYWQSTSRRVTGAAQVVATSVNLRNPLPGGAKPDLADLLDAMNGDAWAWEPAMSQPTKALPQVVRWPRFGIRPPPVACPLPAGVDAQLVDLCRFVHARLDAVGVPKDIRPDDAAVQVAARNQLAQVLIERAHWRGVFSRHQPNLVLAEDGVYASQKGLMLAAAEAGLRSAEIQHGILSLSHVAYNCPTSWRDDPVLRASWPDHLLTLGPWWSDQTTLPWASRRVAGRLLSETVDMADRQRSNVLIIGDAVDMESYLTFSAALAPLVAPLGLRVVFRAHPAVRRLAKEKKDAAVALSDGPLDDALDQAALVVGAYSTVLFEAIDRVPGIVMWDTPARRLFFPAPPFSLISTPQEVADHLGSGLADLRQPHRKQFWQPATRASQRAVLDQIMQA